MYILLCVENVFGGKFCWRLSPTICEGYSKNTFYVSNVHDGLVVLFSVELHRKVGGGHHFASHRIYSKHK